MRAAPGGRRRAMARRPLMAGLCAVWLGCTGGGWVGDRVGFAGVLPAAHGYTLDVQWTADGDGDGAPTLPAGEEEGGLAGAAPLGGLGKDFWGLRVPAQEEEPVEAPGVEEEEDTAAPGGGVVWQEDGQEGEPAPVKAVPVCGGSATPWRQPTVLGGKGTKTDLTDCYRDLTKCGSGALNYARTLPGVKKALKQSKISIEGLGGLDKCAVVGNAGMMLQKDYGPHIDTHDLVVRFNILATTKYKKHVGQKTSIRFLNHARSFAVCKKRERALPEGGNAAGMKNLKVLVLWHPNERERAHKCLEKVFAGKLAVHSFSDKLSEEMRTTMGDLRQDLKLLKVGKGMKASMDGQQLTSGAQAILMLLRMCNQVNVFGVSTYKPVNYSATDGYQYGGRGHLRSSGARYHDWNMESGIWRVLNAAGLINICSLDKGVTYAPEEEKFTKAMSKGATQLAEAKAKAKGRR